MPISIIHPKIVPENTFKILNKLGEGYNKYTQSKWGKPIHEFFVGKDMDLSDEEYMQKHGYGKPQTGLGIAGLVSSVSTPKIISGIGKITDLDKFKKVTTTLSNPEEYITLFHQTNPEALNNIMINGFKVSAGDLLGTATLEGADLTAKTSRLGNFIRGTIKQTGMNHAGGNAGAVIRIPKKEIGYKPGADIEGLLLDKFGPTYTFPKEWVSGILKTQLKYGGILKRR